jgi:hypothetical protein
MNSTCDVVAYWSRCEVGDIPQEVTIEDKALIEQVKLIQELELDEKNMVFKMVDTFLTQKKIKDFFKKNVATL